jgi:hypothetical protein
LCYITLFLNGLSAIFEQLNERKIFLHLTSLFLHMS